MIIPIQSLDLLTEAIITITIINTEEEVDTKHKDDLSKNVLRFLVIQFCLIKALKKIWIRVKKKSKKLGL